MDVEQKIADRLSRGRPEAAKADADEANEMLGDALARIEALKEQVRVSNPATGRTGMAFAVGNPPHSGSAGMSLRVYAAIHLRLPDSGIDWLDEMIASVGDPDLGRKL